MIQAEPELIERVKHRAAARGVSASHVWREAMEHELEDESPVRSTRLIGAFRSGRSDLSRRASEDEYEPEPFR
ncbi:MAG TPA: hypothetical protein VES65_06290 [Solirubrobacteraceae bacterium]|nr:hypothetical protein [Solirubrobacteraceae bacterium]